MVSYYDRNVVFHVDKISTYNPALIYVYISSCQSTGRHITAFFALKPIQLNYYVVLLAVELQKVSAYIHPDQRLSSRRTACVIRPRTTEAAAAPTPAPPTGG